ncbi:hypothetical protein [Polyangium sp. 15x6]|uniref:hypothetical protein n=1 Tax=Polyangium sp. 15x6 TaxID=3042687 RepID=UPI00249AD674|nr:hypothetical protein [Polyangium sp. 15x6]MDI3290119.1 hypothetical protein [Polyangium sp. 15x6]
MNLFRAVRHSVSLLATAGLLSLLLADSAEDYCAESSFDRTFDITTTCGGDLSGRIRVNGTMKVAVSDDAANLSVTKVSGDVAPVAGGVVGACSDEDEPFESTGVSIQLPASATDETGTGGDDGSAGGGGTPGLVATCRVDLKTQLGKDVTCTIDGGGTCTARLTAAQ